MSDAAAVAGVSSRVEQKHDETPDAAIIDRVLGGDARAYALLVARYRDRYARFALHMLGNREDAEEALQDAFVRAYRSLARCTDRDRFAQWLFSILANRCRTAGGRRARRERYFVAESNGQGPHELSEEHPAERRAWLQEIDRALSTLDPAQREAFLLKHVEELEYDEMAEITGAGVSALKMRVKRACERMRAVLREGGDA